MWWPGLRRQRGVEPVPSLDDPRCFPPPAELREVPQGSQPGLWGSWGSLPVSGVTPASSHHACPGGLAAHPQDARRAGPGGCQLGRCSMGIHTWSCCVLGAQAGPTLLCGAAQPLVQWGFWSGAARQADGQLERLVQRRWRGWEKRLWELLLCPTGLSAQPVFLLGTTGFL